MFSAMKYTHDYIQIMFCLFVIYPSGFASDVRLTWYHIPKEHRVALNCSSSQTLKDQSAEFLLNGITVTNILYDKDICYDTATGKECTPEVCQCSISSYVMFYERIKLNKDNTFICKMRLSTGNVSTSNHVSLNVLEPVEVINKTINLLETSVIFILYFYSTTTIHSVEWFQGQHVLTNSSDYYYDTEEVPVQIRKFGTILSVMGFKSNLSVEKGNQIKHQFRVCVTNDFGALCEEFDYKFGKYGPVDTLNLFWIMLGLVIVIPLIGLIVFLVAAISRQIKKDIYHIPQMQTTTLQDDSFQYGHIQHQRTNTSSVSQSEVTTQNANNIYLEVLPDGDDTSDHSSQYEKVE